MQLGGLVITATSWSNNHQSFFLKRPLKQRLKNRFSLSVLTAIFPGKPGLAGIRISPFWILLEPQLTDMVLTTGAISHAKLQSNRHHQQTVTHPFYSVPMPFLSPNQQCQSTCSCAPGVLHYQEAASAPQW